MCSQPFDGGTIAGYGRRMTNAVSDHDDWVVEELGPSLAMPPLYVLRAATRCPKCGQAQVIRCQ